MSKFNHFRIIEKKEPTGELYYLIEYKKYKYFSSWHTAYIPCYNENKYIFASPYVYFNECFKIDNIEEAQRYCDILNNYYKKKEKGYWVFPVFKTYNKKLVAYSVSKRKPNYTFDHWGWTTHITNPVLAADNEINTAIASVSDRYNNLKYQRVING